MTTDRVRRVLGRALTLAAGLAVAPSAAEAQVPLPPTGPAPSVAEPPARRVGPLRRAIRHTCATIQDRFVGYPEYFDEPPLGASLNETLGMMKARADLHDFILYRSDFMDGTTTLSPGGAQRLTQMANRMPCWLGALVIEWTPDRPGLAEARRDAVLTALNGAGVPVVPERVTVGPSPDPGLIGADAASNYGVMLQRDTAAPANYSLTPTSTATFGGGAR